MKKTILFTLMVVGLTALYLVEVSVSQERRAVSKYQGRNLFGTAQQRPRRVLGDQALIDDSQDAKSQRLRNELLQLFQQHLKTMNDEELNAGIAHLRKELGDHEAKAKLQQAEKLLQEILKTYPKRQAAKQARKMLETQGESGEERGAEGEPGATANEADEPTTE